MRWSVVIVLVTFLASACAQPQPSPSPNSPLSDYSCSDSIAKLAPLATEPCNITVYTELGKCGPYMTGNVSAPSAECCASAQDVWSRFPACFCKVTFQTIFPGRGPALARARPQLCNITDDLCSLCPAYLNPITGSCATRIATEFQVPANDPCGNTNAYSELGACGPFMAGNATAPTPKCCSSIQDIWSKYSACLCKVTFFSKFPPPGPTNALARPQLCNITDDMCTICPRYFEKVKSHHNILPTAIGASLIAVILVIGCILVVGCRKRVFRRYYENKEYAKQCHDIRNIEGRPTIFPYHVLKHATKNFNPERKLGEGGFGAVYQGVLPDGMEVAVKKLSAKSHQGKDEFLNEVTLITSVQHRNLVKLRGCCLKGEERLLVYEYLENKSLAQALFEKPRLEMDWQTRMKILEGTARGLAYLHEGCHTRIVHRDIKASNILLDKDLNPKIADFGLARIFSENDTHVSTRVAGTAGYLAPEYATTGQLTEKADVFSYGIVTLELVSGRGNLDLNLESHAVYLLDWAWELYEEEKLADLLDPTLLWTAESTEEGIRVIETALLCTHSRTALRPTMTAVVSILTGGSEVGIPKVARFDVRNYADLDFKFSGSASSKQTDSKSRDHSSQGGNSACSNNVSGVVSVLEPR